jgi:hypothetical protein
MFTMLYKPTRLVLFTAIIIAAVTSCSDNISREEVALFTQIDSSFAIANEQMQSLIHSRMRELDYKMTDPATSERATLWSNKADTVQTYINEAFNYLAGIKLELKDSNSGVEALLTANQIENIKKRLTTCRNTILSVDTFLFSQSIPTIDKNLTDLSFKNLGRQASIAKLGQIQSDLRATESMFVEYCYRRVPIMDDGYTVYQLITSADNHRYYPGEKAKISAGWVTLASRMATSVTIGDHEAKRTPVGDFTHSFTVSRQPGKYIVPVTVDYLDQYSGTKASITKNIEYTVVAKCQ